MKKHETYKRKNNINMQKQNKQTRMIDTPPHNGYKYKSLFIIIIKICLACIGFYNKMMRKILRLEKLNKLFTKI